MLNKEVNTDNNTNISFTKFVDADKKSCKSYGLVNAVLTKSTAGNFYNGTFETMNIPHNQLPNYILSMVPGEFVTQGVHEILTSGECPKDATRAKELFPFTDKAGLLIIDTDSIEKYDGLDDYDDLICALTQIEPAFESAMKFCINSASSFVAYNGVDSGLKGIHTYIPIDTAKNNSTIIEILHIRSVLAGYAFPKVTKSGKVKINSLVDPALKSSNQPVFEGGAILTHSAITQVKQHKIYDGGLLAANAIKPLTEAERMKYTVVVEGLKASVAMQADVVRTKWLNDKGVAIKEKFPDLSDKQVNRIANKAVNNNDLYGQFTIQLESGEVVTVQEILNDRKKYHEVACVHPLEDIVGKTVIYSNQDKPLIHTFAHGEENYYLHQNMNPMPDKLHDSHIASYIADEVKGLLCFDSLNAQWYARLLEGGAWSKEFEYKVIPFINTKIKECVDGFNASKQTSIIKLLTQNIPAPTWENRTDFVPLANGIYDVKEKQLVPYSDKFDFCWQLPYAYDPTATMPVIQQWFVDCGLNHDEIEDIRAFFLMILIGDGAKVQKFLELTGSGGTGKSTLIRLLQEFIGRTNVTVTDLQELENNRFECASFYGKRLILINDSKAYSESCENLKKATGGDELRFEEKNIKKAPPFTYHGFIVVVANQPLQSSDYTTGLSRRRFPITFNRVVTDEEKAKWNHLPEGIESAMFDELGGLFNWVLAMTEVEALGRLRSVTSGLKDSMRKHLVATNKIIGWIDDCLVVSASTNLLVGTKPIERSHAPQKLYESYYWYMIDNGNAPLSNNNFSKALQQAAQSAQIPLKHTKTSSGSCYQGLAIRETKHKHLPTPVTQELLPDFESLSKSNSYGGIVIDDDGCITHAKSK